MRPSLSVLIVAWNSREELARTLPALLPELGEGDELIVVDNDSGDGTAGGGARAGAGGPPRARPVATPASPPAATRERPTARGDLLVILNPDAAPLPGFGEAIRRPWVEEPRLVAWQALVADGGGDADQLGRQPRPLHRDRLGRRSRPPDRRGAAPPAR